MDQATTMLDAFRQFWIELGQVLPRIAVAVVLLLLGWLAARLLRRLAIRFFRLIRLEALAERSGIEDFLIQGGVRSTTITILANLLYWLVLFAVVLALLNALGLGAAADLLNQIVLYLPRVFVAILVLMFGTLFARLIRGVTFTYLSNVGIEGALLISIIAQYAVLVFVVSLALEQLQVGGQVLVSAFQIAFGGFCLALALAFGLGGRDWAARILERTSRSTRG